MGTYILRRVLMVIPTLLFVSCLSFALIRLIPGDPAMIMLGDRAPRAEVEKYKEQMGLNEPIYIQYFRFIRQCLRGDMGKSIVTRVPVIYELGYRLPATIEAIVVALIIGISFGVSMGVLAAVMRNTWVDTIANLTALLGVAKPVFWLALALIYLFGVYFRVLPPGGRISAEIVIPRISGFYLVDSLIVGRPDWFLDALKHMVLPSMVLSTTVMPSIMRLTRASMLEVLRTDYIRTSRAKGLTVLVVIFRHALRNAQLPVITTIGLQIGGLLGGAILTENAFSWTGMGQWFFTAISRRDYPVLQIAIMFNATIFVVMTMLVDISYAFIDPRIRYK